MVINSITIENVKGIERLEIKQTIQPNRPNILVAPNGFGKSSIAMRVCQNRHILFFSNR